MPKLHRLTTTVLSSFANLLKGQPRFMQQYYNVTIISSNKEQLEKIGIIEGVKTYPVELTRQITPLKGLKALWILYHYFQKEKPEIVHTHTSKAGLIGMLAGRIAKVPHRLHTVAGMSLMETARLRRKMLNFTKKLTYRCAHRIYSNSKGLYEFIVKNEFCSEHKLKVIGNGSSNGIDNGYNFPKNTVKAILPTVETITSEMHQILESFLKTNVYNSSFPPLQIIEKQEKYFKKVMIF